MTVMLLAELAREERLEITLRELERRALELDAVVRSPETHERLLRPVCTLSDRIGGFELADDRGLRVHLLEGRIDRADGTAVPIHRRRDYELLLAMSRGSVSRAHLIDLLWPNLDADNAANALAVTLHRVRHLLGRRDAVVRTRDLYQLAADIFIDVPVLLHALHRLTTLPNSPSLAELEKIVAKLGAFFGGSVALPEFSGNTQRQLEALFARATEALGQRYLDAGEARVALAMATRALAVEPLDERVREIAIRAHLACGDRIGALRELRDFQAELARTFGGGEPATRLTSLVTENV